MRRDVPALAIIRHHRNSLAVKLDQCAKLSATPGRFKAHSRPNVEGFDDQAVIAQAVDDAGFEFAGAV